MAGTKFLLRPRKEQAETGEKKDAARMAELGLTDHQIMEQGGWKTLKEVQRYTAGARKKILADAGAMHLLIPEGKENGIVSPFVPLCRTTPEDIENKG